MKKILFFAVLLLQTFYMPMKVCAADESSFSCQFEETRAKRLTSALSQIFKVKVEINGDDLKFVGTQEDLGRAMGILGNFDELRKKVIPVSGKDLRTKACENLEFYNWFQCLECLGISPSENFAIHKENDQNNCLKIPYKSKFDQQIADLYLQDIQTQSPYFKWVNDHNKQLTSYGDDYLFINYGILTEYFCAIAQQNFEEYQGAFARTLSLQGVLKKLTAAAGGEISLVPTSNPDQFHVRTVMLGDRRNSTEEQSPAIIEIAIDKSGSMEGRPIWTINQTMPELLKQLRATLKENESLMVNIHAFDHRMLLEHSYLLKKNHDIPAWKPIGASGQTNLEPIGNLLKTKEGENKVVIAFTDGDHSVSQKLLDDSYRSLKELQASGSFAQPFLCKVSNEDNAAEGNDYFKHISDTFAGSYSEHDTIQGFCDRVSKSIPSLLVSKEPLVLTLSGARVVVWQENAQPDIHTTTQVVGNQDVVMHGGIERKVSVIPVEETKEQKRLRLLAELEALGSD